MREPVSSELAPEPPISGGIGILRDIIVRPERAFAAIAARGEWLPAYLATIAVELVVLYLISPADRHLTLVLARHDPAAAAAAAVPIAYAVALRIGYMALLPLATWGLVAMFLTAATLGRGDGRPKYAVFLALGITCSFVATFGDLIEAICLRLRDPASFSTSSSMLLAAPITLASLRPNGPDAEVSFLAFWDPTRLWAALLLGYGISALTSMRLGLALSLALGITLLLALMQT